MLSDQVVGPKKLGNPGSPHPLPIPMPALEVEQLTYPVRVTIVRIATKNTFNRRGELWIVEVETPPPPVEVYLAR